MAGVFFDMDFSWADICTSEKQENETVAFSFLIPTVSLPAASSFSIYSIYPSEGRGKATRLRSLSTSSFLPNSFLVLIRSRSALS